MNSNQLFKRIQAKQSFLCIGLDPDLDRFPAHFPREPQSILLFNRAIIEATKDLCVAYKPNLAFYEALGSEGWAIFEATLEMIPDDHLIIADAKRGDIGNTSRKYADAFFNQLNCDALTIAPYMGSDSVLPFLEYENKWVVLLGLTSNKGSQDFQSQLLEGGQPLFEKVLETAKEWGSPDQLMFVIGATHPESFARIREIVPDHFFLVPGVGAQGGSLQAVCEYGMNEKCGLLINSSRGILYASNGEDFADAARAAAKELQEQMCRYANL